MTIEPVVIIGIGPGGLVSLSPRAQDCLTAADEIWGSQRLLDEWVKDSRPKVMLEKGLAAEVARLADRDPGRRVVILASGDPGFFGIAATVLRVLPVEEVAIYPHVSCLQTAFARLRLPWQDAALTSAHARPVAEVTGLALRYAKVGILTDPKHKPGWLAEHLMAAGVPDCRAVVLENLDAADERIIDTRLSALPHEQFAPLNVLVLIQDPGWKPVPAFAPRPESAYRHRNGLITKADVRALCLARLALRETDMIWDIGAGSGSVSIEMAELAWRGQVFAVEKDAECLECIRENVQRYALTNLEVIPGEAPGALTGLPSPDAVFIGGSGGELTTILAETGKVARQGCRVVASFALMENLTTAFEWMQAQAWNPEVSMAQIYQGAGIGGGLRLVPTNPIFLLKGIVPDREVA